MALSPSELQIFLKGGHKNAKPRETRDRDVRHQWTHWMVRELPLTTHMHIRYCFNPSKLTIHVVMHRIYHSPISLPNVLHHRQV